MKPASFSPEPPETKPHRVVVYVPSAQADGNPIPNAEALADETSHLLCAKFGGVTRYPATGYFKGAQGKVQTEQIHVLEFFLGNADLEREKPFLDHLLSRLLTELNQESLAWSVDGRMILLQPPGRSHNA